MALLKWHLLYRWDAVILLRLLPACLKNGTIVMIIYIHFLHDCQGACLLSGRIWRGFWPSGSNCSALKSPSACVSHNDWNGSFSTARFQNLSFTLLFVWPAVCKEFERTYCDDFITPIFQHPQDTPGRRRGPITAGRQNLQSAPLDIRRSCKHLPRTDSSRDDKFYWGSPCCETSPPPLHKRQ